MVCASGAPGRQGVEKPDREQCRVRRCSSSLVHQTRRVQQVPVRVVAPFAHRERRRVFDELFGGGSGVFIGRAAPWTSSPLSIRSSQSIAGRRTVRLPAAQGVGGGPEHRQAFGQRRAGLLQDSARDLRDACGVPGVVAFDNHGDVNVNVADRGHEALVRQAADQIRRHQPRAEHRQGSSYRISGHQPALLLISTAGTLATSPIVPEPPRTAEDPLPEHRIEVLSTVGCCPWCASGTPAGL